ncbi:hypothetical protein QYE76_037598 [Lolium multiflorum]|uniref:NAC domain-containing protein n=1 Tax=Lolium multiflorum TaxID=4521 RepID=A0AAD8VE48_LOLMU|nr:hypothetical protein QYE76_037598 [Lolium multiflorum]
MMEAGDAAGVRFHPRDEELVLDYTLLHKLTGRRAYGGVDIVDVDLNKCEPWDLPGMSTHTNRATRSGYWKATGKGRYPGAGEASAAVVGMRKTLVFYQGRAPKGDPGRSGSCEFRLEEPVSTTSSSMAAPPPRRGASSR